MKQIKILETGIVRESMPQVDNTEVSAKNTKNQSHIRLVEINISFEPLTENLPEELRTIKDELLEKVEKQPKKALEIIEGLINKYPEEAILTNWRFAAHCYCGTSAKEIASLIKQDYKKFPDYLFARCAYAELCMTEKNFEAVQNIFDSKFWIGDLYPEREIFHVSEVITFSTTLGHYFCRQGDCDTASKYLELMGSIDNQCEAYSQLLSEMVLVYTKQTITDLVKDSNKKRSRTKLSKKLPNQKRDKKVL